MNEIETFFYTWRYTAGAIFSGTAFILAICRIGVLAHKGASKFIADAADQALVKQRHSNQAEMLDEFIDIIKEQQIDLKRYCYSVSENDIEKIKP